MHLSHALAMSISRLINEMINQQSFRDPSSNGVYEEREILHHGQYIYLTRTFDRERKIHDVDYLDFLFISITRDDALTDRKKTR